MAREGVRGRALPPSIDGFGPVVPFAGVRSTPPRGRRHAPRLRSARPGASKLAGSLRDALRRAQLRDGMTVSFHHHLRNGDGTVNAVLAAAAELGLRDLTVAASSVFAVHAPLVDHIRSGVVTGIDADYIAGPVAQAISHGELPRPTVLRTHGGRVRAIEAGDLAIDVAFVAAPAADEAGNLSGVIGPSACGPLGYAVADAEHADQVVAVTDHLVPYPLVPASISQTRVDHVAEVPRIGDAAGIASGITALSDDPARLAIARTAARAIEAAGVLEDGFSYQCGAGRTALAVTHFVREAMRARGVTGGFGLGGITRQHVEMLQEGLFRRLLDVQDFDLEAVRSLAGDPRHVEISAGEYANPHTGGCAVDRLACGVLGAIGIDTGFDVDVVTGSDGRIMGGSGGHSDIAAGAGLSVVVAALLRRGRWANVTDAVLTRTTPGESIDVLVTDRGVAVNPARRDLVHRFAEAALPVRDIEALRDEAAALGEPVAPVRTTDRIVAVVEYRDGTVIDVVRAVEL